MCIRDSSPDQRAAHTQLRADQGVDRFERNPGRGFDQEMIITAAFVEFVFDCVAGDMAICLLYTSRCV